MTTINFKGKEYELKEVGYREYRKLVKQRKDAMQSNDEDLMLDALETWLKATTNITDSDLDTFSLIDAITISAKVGESQTLPLQPNSTTPTSS